MKKKNLDNYPGSLKILRWWFPKIEWIAPKLAAKIAKKLFFTPLRYKVPAKEKEMEKLARTFKFKHNDQLLQAYEWGDKGPVVILLHGWSGRATQYYEFVRPLVEAGYQVVAFDAPGHNASEGKYSDLVYFAEALIELSTHYLDVRAVVAHSIGGAATLYALQIGLHIQNAVLIGTPSIPSEIIKNFLAIINGSERSGRAITDHILKTYGKPFSDYSAQETAKSGRIPIMLIHDEDDREVTVQHAKVLAEKLPHGRLLLTNGLGHTKILRDPTVIQAAIKFIDQREEKKMKMVS